jgi:hypothetical protein
MAPRTAIDPNELVTGLVFNDTQGNRHVNISLPRRLLANGSVKAKENWLIANGQIPDPSAPPLPDPVAVIVDEVAADRQAAANTAVEQLRAQLDELQGRLSGQPLSIEELTAFKRELTDYMTQAAMAAAQLAVVEGTGSKIRADLVAIATPLNEQAAETARQQAEHEEVQRRVLSDLQAQAAALLEALSQDVAGALSEAEQQAVSRAGDVAAITAAKVAQDVAAKNFGCGVTIVDHDPLTTDAQSIGQMAFARPLTSGDCVLYPGEDALRFYRWNGDSWDKRAGEIVNKVEVRDVRVSAFDNSTKLTAITSTTAPGGSGSGGEKLLSRSANLATSVTIGDSSNWATTTQDPTSGTLLLEVTAVNGSFAGQRGYSSVAFTSNGGVGESTEYALLGDLARAFRFDLTIGRSAAVTPTGITASIPAGKLRTTVALQIVPDPDGGIAAGGTTQFLLSGVLLWVQQSQGTAAPPSAATEQPAWVWQ